MTRSILLTGGSGQVGAALRALRWPDDVRLAAPGRAELDLADTAGLERWLRDRRFAAIINAGAYTAVDKAEEDVAAAWLANAVAPALLARRAAETDAPIVHVSTDYVFDGAKRGAYLESDAVAPLGVYGASKEAGEQAVRTSRARGLIVRTSWVYGAEGKNFLRTMLAAGATRPELRVVDDQRGAPTSAHDLALVLRDLTLRSLGGGEAPTGTVHVANSGETTWCGFARRIFESAAPLGGPRPIVTPITTDAYPTPGPPARQLRAVPGAAAGRFRHLDATVGGCVRRRGRRIARPPRRRRRPAPLSALEVRS